MERHHGRVALAALAVAASFAVPAAAQRIDGPHALDRLRACQRVTDDRQRLTCFDAAAKELAVAEEQHQIVILDQEDVQKTRQSMFGFSIPDLKAFGADHDRPAPPVLHFNGTIKSVKQVSYGRYDMEVNTGAIWRNTDLLDTAPEPGATIKIDHTAMGGYILKVPFSASVHASRVR